MNFKTLLSAFVGALVLAPAANAAAPYSYAVGDKVTVDGEELTIKSENLFVNGNFENGWEGWYDGKDQEPTAEWWKIGENGPDNLKFAYCAQLSNQGSGNPSGLRNYFEMTPGKTYYFFAYSRNGGSNMRLGVNDSRSTSGINGDKDHICDFNGGAEWTKNEAVFKVDVNNWGVIQCGWFGSKEFGLTDVSLYEVEVPEVEALCEPDTYYRFSVASKGTYLSADAEWLTMQDKDAEGFDQVFSFVETETEGVYNLATSNGLFFINKGNGWNANVETSPDLNNNRSKVSITQKGETISIKVLSSNFLGSDNAAAANTGVYCDKSGSTQLWFTVEAVEGAAAPDTEALEAVHNEAMEFLNDATIGTEAGNYSQEAADALEAAMEASEEALDAKTQGTVNAAAVKLTAALNAFKNSQVCVPTTIAESTYKINAEGTDGYLYVGWKDNVKQGFFIDGADRTEGVGEFTVALVEGEENLYTIACTDGYLANNGGSLRPTSTLGNDAYFTFETFGVENTYKVKNAGSGKYLGTQWGSYYNWVNAATDLGADAPGAKLVFVNQAPTTGVENVAAEAEAVEYFNLQGIRVAEPANGLFIRRQGNNAKTVLVK